MKKTIKLACFLGILCAIAGAALAAVNNVTAPIIEEAQIANEKANLELIYPGATFEQITDYEDETGLVQGVYKAEGQGYIFKLSGMGYNSNGFTFMVAFNNDGTVGGYTALEQAETDGFGTRCWDEDYVNQVMSLTSTDAFPTLSGATLTSSAVVRGINAAKAIFNSMNGIEYDPNASAEPAAPTFASGNPVAIADDFGDFKAECSESSSDGDVVTYACNARGYGLIDPEGHASESTVDYQRNEFEVVIDKATMSVVSVNCTSFGDTPGMGDKATVDDYYQLFVGLTADDSVDTVTGATWTSESLVACVQAALQAAAQ